MNPDTHQVYFATAAMIFVLGLGGLVLCRHFLKKILGAAMLTSASFLVLVAVGYRDEGMRGDPVPHALVITGIVVGVSACAFAIGLARRITRATGRTGFDVVADPEDADGGGGIRDPERSVGDG